MRKFLMRGTAWRWMAAFVLMVAVALPLLPTAAFAASADNSAEWAGNSNQCADVHWVRQGENLSQIARWYGVSVQSIVWANNISNPSVIVPGQRLCIPFDGGPNGHPGGGPPPSGHPGGGPPPSNHPGGNPCSSNCGHSEPHGCWYTVRQGDNLSEIASWFGVSWSYLARVNCLDNPRVIVPGQVLYVCR